MIDWQGLLKFTLKYSDGTSQSEFKEMTTEDKKWLEEAMNHYCNSEITRIQNILKELEKFTEYQEENLLAMLQQLQELLDSLDKGSSLYKMGGHITLLKIIFYSKSEKCRIIALQIYSSANQNDAGVQNESINTGALEIMDLLKKQENITLKQGFLSAISATIRGQNLEAKRIFVRLNGLEMLESLNVNASPKLKNKINTLWRDLLYYDDKLHFTYNDLSSFSNTANIKSEEKEKNNYDLSYDPNKELQAKNQLPKNAEYRGCIHKFLETHKQLFMGYLEWLKEQIKNQNEH